MVAKHSINWPFQPGLQFVDDFQTFRFADPDTGLLLGGHVIGPDAANLVQPLIQAMSFGQDARSLARGQYWIHPALAEVVENALLDLPLA